MRIGCIGWGSLIWKPGDLLVDKNWRDDGPQLPIEFLRTSQDGRLTLVISDSFPLISTYWSLMTTSNIPEAIESLRDRENCPTAKPIGMIKSLDRVPENAVKKTIHSWLQTKDVDAVIWTDLGPKFNDERGRIATVEEALDYLSNLSSNEQELAEEYVRKAPEKVATVYRSKFEEAFGWLPIYPVQ